MDRNIQAVLLRSGAFTVSEIREFSAAWAEMSARPHRRQEIDVTNLSSMVREYIDDLPRSPPATPRPMVCAGCGAPLNLLTCSYCLRDNRSTQ